MQSGFLVGTSPPGSRKMPDRSASGFPSRSKAGRTSASRRPFRHVQQRSRVPTRPACTLEQPALACRAARRLRLTILGRRKWPGKHRRSSKCRSAWKLTCTPAQRASNPRQVTRDTLPGSCSLLHRAAAGGVFRGRDAAARISRGSFPQHVETETTCAIGGPSCFVLQCGLRWCSENDEF